MKFYHISFFILLGACKPLLKTSPVGTKQTLNNERTEIHIPKLTSELKELQWQDSTWLNFIAIHCDAEINLLPPCVPHSTLRGPLILSHPFFDTTRLQPIKFDWHTSYFLVDDFEHITDSILTFIYQVSYGSDCQSTERFFTSSSSLPKMEIQKYTSSQASSPEKKYATRAWYSQWCKAHPEYKASRPRQ